MEETDFLEGTYPRINTTIKFGYSHDINEIYILTGPSKTILGGDSDLHYVVEIRGEPSFFKEGPYAIYGSAIKRIHISSEGNIDKQFRRALKTHFETVKEIRKVEGVKDLEKFCLESEQLTTV